jgi:murein DD-endopeptidase MepM/ murein hydrolase activator NlpD
MKQIPINHKYVATLILFGVFFATSYLGNVSASEIDDLRAQIESRNKMIQGIEAEIAKYQIELDKTAGQSKTLQNAIKALNLSRDKYLREIKLTENKIAAKNLEISKLSNEISDKEQKLNISSQAVMETLRRFNELDGDSMVAIMLRHNQLSDYFSAVDSMQKLQDKLHQSIISLAELKQSLEGTKIQAEKNKKTLLSYKTDLSDQKKIIDNNKAEKDQLLQITKNKEAEYQKLIQEKLENKKQFENELFLFESQLKIKIDPTLIPSAGRGILSWPLDSVTVTQQFGKTVDAARLYVSGTHSGTDFRASVGTKVKAVLSGVVEATGDTDQTCSNASYGKWVLVKHTNGLSSLYAHLDLIGVSKGQVVATGEKVGYSGNTGYSTGPHLHLGLYASQGVRVSSLPSNACKGAVYTIPVADPKAYLDPMAYF